MAFNATLLRLKMFPDDLLVGLLVSEETSTDFQLTKDTLETTARNSSNWSSRIGSMKSAKLTCQAFVNYSPKAGSLSYTQLYTIFDQDGGSVKCEFSTSTVGSIVLTGNFVLTELDTVAEKEAGATLAFTLLSDGPLVATIRE